MKALKLIGPEAAMRSRNRAASAIHGVNVRMP